MKKLRKYLTCFLLPITLISCSKNREPESKVGNPNAETKVSIEQSKKLIDENKELIIFDVRTKEEYDSGHIKDAILIPYDEVDENIEVIKQYKDKPVLVYCRTGKRSAIAIKSLIDNGFSNIYHMYEGVSMWEYDLVK